VPSGTPKWGRDWKRAVKASYLNTMSFDVHGANMVYRDVYVDLDPNYKDAFGQPLLRFTFDWKDNDIRMSRYVTDQAVKIAHELKAREIKVT
ncbi:GMC family oxidoreductase, partial [Acinetobacter baumannii]